MAARSMIRMNGIIPSWDARIGKLRQPVPKAEASIAKMEPLMLPFLIGR